VSTLCGQRVYRSSARSAASVARGLGVWCGSMNRKCYRLQRPSRWTTRWVLTGPVLLLLLLVLLVLLLPGVNILYMRSHPTPPTLAGCCCCYGCAGGRQAVSHARQAAQQIVSEEQGHQEQYVAGAHLLVRECQSVVNHLATYHQPCVPCSVHVLLCYGRRSHSLPHTAC